MFNDLAPISKDEDFFTVFNCTRRLHNNRCYKTIETAAVAAKKIAENHPTDLIAILEVRHHWQAENPVAKIV